MNRYRDITRGWLKRLIKSSGRGTQARLARHLRVRPDAITRMVADKPGKEVRTITAEELLAIADFFGVSPPTIDGDQSDGTGIGKPLIEHRNLPIRSSTETDNNPPPPLPIWGYVQAGQWLEVGTAMDEDLEEKLSEQYPVALDPRYPPDAQFGVIVRGTSVNKFAPEGALLVCVDYWKLGIAIHDGDLVIVQRRRDHGSLYEVTAKIVERVDGKIRLRPYSNDPRWQSDLEVDELSLFDDHDGEIRIVGKVVWAAAMAPNTRR